MKATHSLARPAVAVAAVLLLSACAGARVDGQWSAPEFAGSTLRDRPVMVSCRALDDTVRRICEDRLALQVAESGARPVRGPEPTHGADGLQSGEDYALAAARRVGAQALVRTSVMSSGAVASGVAPSIGVGLGGGSGRFGIGGGISLPIGGARITESYAASTSVVDVATGRPMWSVRTSAPGSADVAGQVEQLTQATVAAMRQAGLF
jgi:hypothetical protein